MNSIFNNAWCNDYQSGRDWCRKGEMEKAIAAFRASISINPNHAATHHDLGVIFHQQGRYDDAFVCFQRAIELDKRISRAWFNGGTSLCALRRLREAVAWFRQAVQICPDFADAHYNLANIYKAMEMKPAAIAHYHAAIKAQPMLPEAYNNMGTLYLGDGELEQAMTCFQKALALNSSYSQAAYNLSLTLKQMGRVGEAIAYARRVMQMRPDHEDALALLVPLYQQTCDWPALSQAQDQLEELTCLQLKAGRRPAESPFLSFTRSPQALRNLKIASAWSQWLIKRHQGAAGKFDFNDRRKPHKRLTIGYLSERFRNAATAHLMAGLFGRHDRSRFKIMAYSWGRDDGSPYRRKISRDVDHFVDIRALSDTEAAKRICQDKVDILIDLMGWMHGHRMGILAQRPAPIQVNYLGYPSTTGTPFIQYILADRVVIPPEHQPYYSEKVIYLPDCYLVNDPDPPVNQYAMGRDKCGLPERAVVLCSFNAEYKIDPHLFDIWMKIMRAIPHSVLWLFGRTPEVRENMRRAAVSCGVDPGRLIFAVTLSKEQHLARMKLADLALDTFMVNGHTTTIDAVWSGVPVITCQGTHFASRVTSSILQAVGMPELVTRHPEDYQRLAIELASEPDALASVKEKLARNRFVYPLFDCTRFARNIEASFERMWQIYLSGRQPEAFAVKRI
jgi:predicted O-linked N-acetylglucosamine transferase (SPINDLY family)